MGFGTLFQKGGMVNTKVFRQGREQNSRLKLWLNFGGCAGKEIQISVFFTQCSIVEWRDSQPQTLETSL